MGTISRIDARDNQNLSWCSQLEESSTILILRTIKTDEKTQS